MILTMKIIGCTSIASCFEDLRLIIAYDFEDLWVFITYDFEDLSLTSVLNSDTILHEN